MRSYVASGRASMYLLGGWALFMVAMLLYVAIKFR